MGHSLPISKKRYLAERLAYWACAPAGTNVGPVDESSSAKRVRRITDGQARLVAREQGPADHSSVADSGVSPDRPCTGGERWDTTHLRATTRGTPGDDRISAEIPAGFHPVGDELDNARISAEKHRLDLRLRD